MEDRAGRGWDGCMERLDGGTAAAGTAGDGAGSIAVECGAGWAVGAETGEENEAIESTVRFTSFTSSPSMFCSSLLVGSPLSGALAACRCLLALKKDAMER